MPVFIALLRGINVSGHKPVPMAELKALFEKLGYAGARTYIQSGNVVFAGPKAANRTLAASLEAAIAKRFGFEVPVMVRTLEELIAIVDGNPYAKRKLAEGERVHISYLEAVPDKAALLAFGKIEDENDECLAKKSEVYILARIGYGETRFSNAMVEKTLGVRSTTRNLETSRKLIDLGSTLG